MAAKVALAMHSNPIAMLRAAVLSQTGPDRAWHIGNLFNHERRYLADLQIVAALAPAGKVLEVGSAPCHMTALLGMTGYPVVGVDIDPGRVSAFVEQFGLDVRRCNIECSPLPFGDAEFACVLLCETFEHLRIDPAFVLSEINRVLLPGAPLLLTTPNVYSAPSLGRFLLGRSVADPLTEFGKLRGLGHMGHVREYSAREVGRFLEWAGLAVESIDYRYSGRTHGHKRAALAFAFRLLPRPLRRDIVIVARKTHAGPNLAPLLPLNG